MKEMKTKHKERKKQGNKRETRVKSEGQEESERGRDRDREREGEREIINIIINSNYINTCIPRSAFHFSVNINAGEKNDSVGLVVNRIVKPRIS